MKDASIYSLKGVRIVEEDKYIKWIEEVDFAAVLRHLWTQFSEQVPLGAPLSYVDGRLIKTGGPEPAPVPAKPVVTPETKRSVGR